MGIRQESTRFALRTRGPGLYEFTDEVAPKFADTWERLNIANDDFIRTTEERHIRVVQQVLSDLWERGEIYRDEYDGWYCVPCERFWMEKDLVDGNGCGHCRSNCPDCDRPVERIVELAHGYGIPVLVDGAQAMPHDAVDVQAGPDGPLTTQSVFAGSFTVQATVTRGTPIITVKPNATTPEEAVAEAAAVIEEELSLLSG